MNRISVLFFLVDLYFSYLFIHEIDKLRVMCGIPLRAVFLVNNRQNIYIKMYFKIKLRIKLRREHKLKLNILLFIYLFNYL